MMGEKKLILDKPKDVDKMISFLEERIVAYEKKIVSHYNRKEWRRENEKFELYRGRFYRDLKEEKRINHQVDNEKIKEWWLKMWEENNETQSEMHKEYLPEYSLSLEEQ